MEGVTQIPQLDGLKLASSALVRFAPQPKSFGNIDFQALLATLGSVTGAVTGEGGLSSEYQTLLQEQLEVQRQMFLMSLYSNLEKSRHETQMAAVRNVRVG